MSDDEARLSAYALGELEGDERAGIEARLAADPSLRRELDAIRRTADLLTLHLARPEIVSPIPGNRQKIEALLREHAAPAATRKETPVQTKTPWITFVEVGVAFGCVGMIAIAALNATGGSVNSLVQKVSASLATVGGGWVPSSPAPQQYAYLPPVAAPVTEITIAPSAMASPPPPPLPPSQELNSTRVTGIDGTTSTADPSVPHNEFVRVEDQALSTFSIDVDTASYAMVRRYLTQATRPPAEVVRIEEMLNYFEYDYPAPTGKDPFAVHLDAVSCPWNKAHRLVKIGLKGRVLDSAQRKPTNLVFLIDVSGSMGPEDRLPLLKKSMKLLIDQLGENDRVSIVVYAGASGLVLPPTTGDRKAEVLGALERLEAGGSTNGGQGIELAYETAVGSFIPGGVNRVVLATDGDFNVGVTSQTDLLELIQSRAKTGVFLSVLGVGMGNTRDSTLEMLADKGNGNYAYLDDLKEARKVLVEQMGGTLVTIAKDVKLQVEFNSLQVEAYRLIGYENRMLAAQDFNDDTKDAGELGAGHTVTALYEVVPVGTTATPSIDPKRYQKPGTPVGSDELLFVKLRYKLPDEDVSQLLGVPLIDQNLTFEVSSPDLKFAAAVAGFGMILRGSPHRGDVTWDTVATWAREGLGTDRSGYRNEFLALVGKAQALVRAGR